MKNKLIIKLIILFLIILCIPIFFHKDLKFDYGIFFTEYYIFFLNAFLVVTLGTTLITKWKSSINENTKRKKLLRLLNTFHKNIKKKTDLEISQIYWETIKKIIDEIDCDEILMYRNFKKINRFIKSLSINNIDVKSKTLEYKELIDYLDNIIKSIAK